MKTEEAYNRWAATYDNDENLTRTLDEKVLKTILSDIKGKDIIEAGCGTGKNTFWLAQRANSINAFDFSDKMLKVAKEKIQLENVIFKKHNITTKWPYIDNFCDIVTINLVLEHIQDITTVFKEAYRVLKPSGNLYICELHPKKVYFQAGKNAGFRHVNFVDWFDEIDNNETPRLLSMQLAKI